MITLLNKFRDKLRTLAGIRSPRELPPEGDKPFIGTNIVREKLRIRLKYPINDELWKWLSSMGWRAVDMRNNRRHYTVVPDRVLIKLIKADTLERHILHNRLIKTKAHRNMHGQTLNLNTTQEIIHKSKTGIRN